MKKKLLLFAFMAIGGFSFISAQITTPAPYCVATFDDIPFNVDDAIKSVTLGTLNNVTNGQCAAPHYIFYNNLTAPTVIKGTAYTLTVIFNVAGGAGYGVWIDYNHNNTFETSEKVAGTTGATSMNISANTTITQSITIPTTATTGATRMRVRIVEDDNYTQGTNYTILPCNLSTSATDVMDWGETEDYNVNITATNGIAENNEDVQFEIYPNPANDVLTIHQTGNKMNELKVINLQGQEVINQTMNNTADEITISVKDLPKGIYFVQLYSNKGIAYKKFVVSR
ncbi:MAG: T9SS type A sorting domain-containing protein [Bacteroidales bacterium]